MLPLWRRVVVGTRGQVLVRVAGIRAVVVVVVEAEVVGVGLGVGRRVVVGHRVVVSFFFVWLSWPQLQPWCVSGGGVWWCPTWCATC